MKVAISTMNFTRSALGTALRPSDMVHTPAVVVPCNNERRGEVFPKAV
jgi:hypothetical protein